MKRSSEDALLYVLAGLGIIAMLGFYVAWADFIHNDWRCAFAQCRIETP